MGLLLLLLALALALPATAVDMKSGMRVVVQETGADPGPDSFVCKDFRMSEHDVREFLHRAIPVTPREVHDHYLYLPCFVRGTLETAAGITDWTIRAGGLALLTLPDGSNVQLADPLQREEPGP